MAQTTTPTRNLIFSIYAHLLLAISVLVVAVGTYMLINNLTGRFVMSQYPLGWEESRCEHIGTEPTKMEVDPDLSAEERAAEQARLEKEAAADKQACEAETERLRANREQTDLANAINTLVVGFLLLIPHAIMVKRLNRKD